MNLFVNFKKVKKCLQINDAHYTVNKFGSRGYKHLQKMVFSESEPIELRKKALQVLVMLGIDYSKENSREFSKKLKLFPELKKQLIEYGLSELANVNSKQFIIKLFSYDKEFKDEILNYIHSKNDKTILEFIREYLKNGNDEYLAVSCVELLAAIDGKKAIPILLDKLNSLKDWENSRDYLVESIVETIKNLDASGTEIENALINKLNEISFDDSTTVLNILKLQYKTDIGRIPNPIESIFSLIIKIGGTSTIKGLIDLSKKEVQKRNMNFESIGHDDTFTSDDEKTVKKTTDEKLDNFQNNLKVSIDIINKKLMESGTITPSQNIENSDNNFGNKNPNIGIIIKPFVCLKCGNIFEEKEGIFIQIKDDEIHISKNIGLEGGEIKCSKCKELHDFLVPDEGKLTLQLVSTPIGYSGQIKKAFDLKKFD